MFKLISEPRSLLYQLDVEVPGGLEFEQIEWQEIQITGAINKSKFTLRQTACDIDHLPVLSKFFKDIRDFQYNLLEHLWQNSRFQTEWAGYTLDQLKLNTSTFCEACKDSPGFDTGIHLDNRKTVTAGMVFFNHNVIEEKSTTFYNDGSGNYPLIMPCAYGQGWYSANNPYSWHRGVNSSNDIRYSVKFGIHLNMIY